MPENPRLFRHMVPRARTRKGSAGTLRFRVDGPAALHIAEAALQA